MLIFWSESLKPFSGLSDMHLHGNPGSINHCGEFRCEVRRAQLARSTLLTYRTRWCPWDLSDLLRSDQMLKREWGAESNGKLPHLSIPGKTAARVPEFAVENLPLGRTVALVLEFAVKRLPLGRILEWMKGVRLGHVRLHPLVPSFYIITVILELYISRFFKISIVGPTGLVVCNMYIK